MDVGLHPLCLLRRSVQHHMPRVLHSALLLQAGAAPANDAYVRHRTPCWFLTLGSAIPTECCLASMTCIGYSTYDRLKRPLVPDVVPRRQSHLRMLLSQESSPSRTIRFKDFFWVICFDAPSREDYLISLGHFGLGRLCGGKKSIGPPYMDFPAGRGEGGNKW